ncbi:hypothetical protein ARMSODRAFT_622017 [Armillaria solidipes]|uniref:Uncharacterized protein n=1 Tax=Armillaria solidipes TaxID=1076256 RepID=A0A2H3B451_9AGAR|nr:hypothetical protein ARMSODRAFT_622017 [Armillaria solidipes]
MFARISLLALPLLASASVIPVVLPRNDIEQGPSLYPVICPNAPPIPAIARGDSFVITDRQIPAFPAPPAIPVIPRPARLCMIAGRQVITGSPVISPGLPR